MCRYVKFLCVLVIGEKRMARPKKEVNPVRAQRLAEIITDAGITQTELSKHLGISQQTISRILNGSASLTETTAKLLVHEFPAYRFEWIMGLDDYKTVSDYDRFQRERDAKIETSLEYLTEFLLNKRGYHVRYGIKMNGLAAEDQSEWPVYIYKDGIRIGSLTLDEWHNLNNHAADYVEFYMLQAIKKAGESHDE